MLIVYIRNGTSGLSLVGFYLPFSYNKFLSSLHSLCIVNIL